VTDGGTFAARAGETAAASRLRSTMLERLMALLEGYAVRHPFAPLVDALAYCERIGAAECGPEIAERTDRCGRVAAAERILTRRFAHVFLVDARAGSFPPYYVPDAFLFSQTYGMIPKESAGDAPARARQSSAGTNITPNRAPRSCASSGACSPPRWVAPTKR